ncbi:MAG: TolC family protein [Muribaculaceae bacterium]|nr:TolC family protein [Muribaculaceae bacterium]
MTHRLLATLILLLPIATLAQTTFDNALATLIQSNPSVRSQQLRAESENLNLEADNQLAGPEAEFSRVWGSNSEVGNKWALSVSQSFDWPGVYAARRQAARQARSASQYLLESTMVETRAQARQLLLDAIHLAQLLDMHTSLAQRVDSLESYFRIAASEGIETRLDYNKTVIERIAVHRELHSLQSQWSELMAQISAFGGGIDPAPLVAQVGTTYPPAPALPTAPSIEMLRERDPAYAAAMEQRKAAQSMVKVERRQRMPGFSVGYVHETELGGNFDGFSIGITLPTWGRNRKALAASLEAEASLADAEMELATTHATMKGDLKRLSALKEIIDEYAPVVESKEQFTLLRSALDARLITYLTYIEESNYIIAARRDYIDTLWEYHTLLGRLARFD